MQGSPQRTHGSSYTFGTLAVQAFPLSDVKAYMGHADIQTTMIYVHHVPQIDAADKLSDLVTGAQNPVSGHARDTNEETDDAAAGEVVPFPARSKWAAWIRTRDQRIMSLGNLASAGTARLDSAQFAPFRSISSHRAWQKGGRKPQMGRSSRLARLMESFDRDPKVAVEVGNRGRPYLLFRLDQVDHLHDLVRRRIERHDARFG